MTYTAPIAPTGHEPAHRHPLGAIAPDRPRRGAGRRELIASALSLTAERGLHAIRLRGVAKRAGLAVGSSSYHFDSREDLILAALDSYTTAAQSEIAAARLDARAMPFPAGAGTVLRAALTDLYCDRDSAMVRGEIYLEAARDEAVADMARTLRSAIESLLVDFSRVAGQPAEDAHTAARTVAAALDYAVLDAVTGDSAVFAARMNARIDELIGHDLTGVAPRPAQRSSQARRA